MNKSTYTEMPIPQSPLKKRFIRAHRSNKNHKINILKKPDFYPFPRSTIANSVQTLETSPGPSFDISNINKTLTPIFKRSTSSFPFFIQEPPKRSKFITRNKKTKSLLADSEKSLNLIGKTYNHSHKKRIKANIFSKKGKKGKSELSYINKSYFKSKLKLSNNSKINEESLNDNESSLPAIHKSNSFIGFISNPKSEIKPKETKKCKKDSKEKETLQHSMTIKGWDVDIKP